MNITPTCIIAILRDHSTPSRGLSYEEIKTYLEDDFFMKVDVHAIRRNLLLLKGTGDEFPQLGFRIECAEKVHETRVNRSNWRLIVDSDFEPSEARLLIDSIMAYDLIPPRQRRDLLKRVAGLPAEPVRVPVVNNSINMRLNKQFFNSVDVMDEALREKRWVRFNLGYYAPNGEVKYDKSAKQHCVLPLQLVMSHGRYYLVAQYASGDIYHFRMDLILNAGFAEFGGGSIQSKTTKDTGAHPGEQIDPTDYRARHSFMMTGKSELVRFRISDEYLYVAFDQFGKSVSFVDEGNGYMIGSIITDTESIKYWALQFPRRIEILEPASLRNAILAEAQYLVEKYSEKA